MSSGPPNLIGTVLDGRYRIVAMLGQGGMGFVYEGLHVTLDRKIAVKTLHPRLAYEEKFRERFLREAKSASKVRHPNVVQIMDFGDTPDGSVYFVMEYLAGRDLRSLLREHGKLPWPRAKRILLQAVAALRAAHEQGIIHRDIKPGNCFLYESQTERVTDMVKLLDFGIAKAGTDAEQEGGAKLTGTGEIFGTAAYMAPEQARGEPLDPRSDVYSLGIMAYEMLTGRVPFTGVNAIHVITMHLNETPVPLRELDPSIPAEVEALVLRAIAKEKDDRFASMGELERALRAVGDAVNKVSRPKTVGWEGRKPLAPGARAKHPASGPATAVRPPKPKPRTGSARAIPPPPTARPHKTASSGAGRAVPPGRRKTEVSTDGPASPPARPAVPKRSATIPRAPSPSRSAARVLPPSAAKPVKPRSTGSRHIVASPPSDVPVRRPKSTTEPAPTALLKLPVHGSASSRDHGAIATTLPVSAEASAPGVAVPAPSEASAPGVPTALPSTTSAPSIPLIPGAPAALLPVEVSSELLATPSSGKIELPRSPEETNPPPGQHDHPTSPGALGAAGGRGTGPLARQDGLGSAAETNPHRIPARPAPSGLRRAAVALGVAAVLLGSTAATLAIMGDGDEPGSAPEVKTAVAVQTPRSEPSAARPRQDETQAPATVEPEPEPEPVVDEVVEPEPEPAVDEVAEPEPEPEPQEPQEDLVILEDELLEDEPPEDEPLEDDQASTRANHLTQACAERRAAAQTAFDQGNWGDLLKTTALASCWPRSEQSKRRGFRVYAYFSVGKYAKCVAAGRYVRDPKIKPMVATCNKRLKQ